MKVATVLFLGSTHSCKGHPNNILVQLFNNLNKEGGDHGKILDGPDTIIAFHKAHDAVRGNRQEAHQWLVDKHQKEGPLEKVNIVGHSRGAVTAHMLANSLQEKRFKGEINVLVFDPVSRAQLGTTAEINLDGVKRYWMVVMQHETKMLFKPVFPRNLTKIDNGITSVHEVMPVYGKHASCVDLRGTNLGFIGYEMARYFLRLSGTKFRADTDPPWQELCEKFARVWLEHRGQKLSTEHERHKIEARWGHLGFVSPEDIRGSGFVKAYGPRDTRSTKLYSPMNSFNVLCLNRAINWLPRFIEGTHNYRLSCTQLMTLYNRLPTVYRALRNSGFQLPKSPMSKVA